MAKEYEIFVPLKYNDGTPVEARKFQDLQQDLLAQFPGLTFSPQPKQGFWTMAGVAYRDEIVIYHVITPKVRAARRFLKLLKKRLERELRQEKILILERDVREL